MTAAAIVMAACLGGCGEDRKDRRQVILIASGDTAGWIVPCGCTSNQSGGLQRRATFVGQQRERGPVVLVDVGGAASGTSAYERAKFEAVLAGEAAMKITAHNLGASEAALGEAYLRSIVARETVPVVSANLRGKDGKLIAPPVRIVEAGGLRLAIVGVLSERYAAADLKVDPPKRAILDQVAACRGRFDSLIVLAYVPEDELVALAGGVPEADVVLGGPTGQSVAPRKLGPTLLAAATNKGKFLVRLDRATPVMNGTGETATWSGEVVEMHAGFADDPQQEENLRRFRAALARADFTPEQTQLVAAAPAGSPADYRIAGLGTCRECHAEDCTFWQKSKHAESWGSLEKDGNHVDPFCQHCHTEGYGLPGGFVSLRQSAADRRHIGCETCHGPSQAHVVDPKVKTPFAAKDQCARCHDAENSPKFNYNEYWDKIKHGPPFTKSNEPKSRAATRPEGGT